MKGGKKYDQAKIPVGLLSTTALMRIAEVMGFGAKKYGSHNWRAGIAWSRVSDAALRHLLAWKDGEDKDPESGLNHLAHLGCCVLFLLEYLSTHPELDDRWKGTK
jgi:dATP/dGTP diphosphohydrolase